MVLPPVKPAWVPGLALLAGLVMVCSLAFPPAWWLTPGRSGHAFSGWSTSRSPSDGLPSLGT